MLWDDVPPGGDRARRDACTRDDGRRRWCRRRTMVDGRHRLRDRRTDAVPRGAVEWGVARRHRRVDGPVRRPRSTSLRTRRIEARRRARTSAPLVGELPRQRRTDERRAAHRPVSGARRRRRRSVGRRAAQPDAAGDREPHRCRVWRAVLARPVDRSRNGVARRRRRLRRTRHRSRARPVPGSDRPGPDAELVAWADAAPDDKTPAHLPRSGVPRRTCRTISPPSSDRGSTHGTARRRRCSCVSTSSSAATARAHAGWPGGVLWTNARRQEQQVFGIRNAVYPVIQQRGKLTTAAPLATVVAENLTDRDRAARAQARRCERVAHRRGRSLRRKLTPLLVAVAPRMRKVAVPGRCDPREQDAVAAVDAISWPSRWNASPGIDTRRTSPIDHSMNSTCMRRLPCSAAIGVPPTGISIVSRGRPQSSPSTSVAPSSASATTVASVAPYVAVCSADRPRLVGVVRLARRVASG